jgi:hypothetical protein
VHAWIGQTKKRGDTVEVHAIVRWNGVLYRDRLIIAADEHGRLKIASKLTFPVNREVRPRTGYGG